MGELVVGVEATPSEEFVVGVEAPPSGVFVAGVEAPPPQEDTIVLMAKTAIMMT